MEQVLYAGHSYVTRLHKFMVKTNRENFEFNPRRTQVKLSGRGGATIPKLVSNGLFEKLAEQRPIVLIFDVGTNDIDRRGADAIKLATDLVRLAVHCTQGFQSLRKVLFCPVLPRGPGRFQARTADFQRKAELFNTTLKHLCAQKAVPNVSMVVLKHVRFTALVPSLLCDGVHLNEAGLKRYYFSLRTAIVAALK